MLYAMCLVCIALVEVGDHGRWAFNSRQRLGWPAEVQHCGDVGAW